MGKNILYLLTILESIEKITLYSEKFKNADEFFWANDQLNFNATINLLIAIGEEGKKVSSDIKQKYSNLPWKQMAGLRDKMAHDYRGIDASIVWRVVQDELPKLKALIIAILEDFPDDKAGLKEILSTKYYQHIRSLF